MLHRYHRQLTLCLHGIGELPDCRNEAEQPYWISVKEFENLLVAVSEHNKTHRVEVRLAFDDANTSDIDIVLPRLISIGVAASFFVPTDHIGLEGYLDSEAIANLANAGMTIGSHSCTHSDWVSRDISAVEVEMIRSKKLLEAITASPVVHVAPPYGLWTYKHVQLAKSVGYQRFFTCEGRTSGASQFLCHRLVVRNDMNWKHDIQKRTNRLRDIWSMLRLSDLRKSFQQHPSKIK